MAETSPAMTPGIMTATNIADRLFATPTIRLSDTMTHLAAAAAPVRIVLLKAGALALGARHAAWLSPDGEIEELTLAEDA